MPFAITLPLDNEASRHIVALWKLLAHHGQSDDSLRLGYLPHVTLAICPDKVAPHRLQAALEAAAGHAGMQLSLASVGVFAGTPAVLFLAPVVTPALLDLQAAAVDELGSCIHAHYRQGAWVPHVTLAKDLCQPGPALETISGLSLPVAARVENVELVRFRPVQVLATRPLQ